jgi:peptide chain release factor 3
VEILDGAGAPFDPADILAGNTTPVFFGSALNNFGVQLLMDSFLDYSAIPAPRKSGDTIIPTDDDRFSGFIFKILANMDPNHRDRIAFLRVCSGTFSRDMGVHHSRTGKRTKLSYSHKLFGREREILDEAYAGDIVGIVGHSEFGIGDTLSEDPAIVYNEIPKFTPECFAYIHNPNPSKFKRFREGMDQLLQEGVVQELNPEQLTHNVRLLAAVGPLQFEVVQYRMESEYGAEVRLEPGPWKFLRWVSPEVGPNELTVDMLTTGSTMVRDGTGHRAILFPNDWAQRYFKEKHPRIEISEQPFDIHPAAAPTSRHS